MGPKDVVVANPDDRQAVMQAVGENGFALHFASDRLRNDKEIVMRAISTTSLAIQCASDSLRADPDIALHALKSKSREHGYYDPWNRFDDCAAPGVFTRCSHFETSFHYRQLNSNVDFMTQAVKIDHNNLRFASQELLSNRDFLLKVAAMDRRVLGYLSVHRRDPEFMMEVVSKDGMALKHAAAEIKADKSIACRACAQNVEVLKHVPSVLRRDLAFAQSVVSENGCALKYLMVRGNATVVSIAVTQDGRALQYASKDLRNSEPIVLQAVSQNGIALTHASNKLRNSEVIVMQAVSESGEALRYASQKLQSHREIVLRAISQCGRALWYASEALHHDRQFIFKALALNPFALQGLKGMRDSKYEGIVMHALSQNGSVIQHYSGGLEYKLVSLLQLKLAVPLGSMMKSAGNAELPADCWLLIQQYIHHRTKGVSSACHIRHLAPLLRFALCTFKSWDSVVGAFRNYPFAHEQD
eukprot:TRINITY_DN77484_c0_g1_i1.p1 TRINITY_DN77484_c0_g1~~TRINITY_DN77484_c0_g1_i1.p1  ORF type:complete len:490 (+),score=66.13 TRINITY_DN77484_c0_g1_i1:56-1471(+)